MLGNYCEVKFSGCCGLSGNLCKGSVGVDYLIITLRIGRESECGLSGINVRKM